MISADHAEFDDHNQPRPPYRKSGPAKTGAAGPVPPLPPFKIHKPKRLGE